MTHPVTPIFVPLGTQLLRRVLLVALFCAVVASVVQAFWVSNQGRRGFDRVVEDITRARLAPLSAALWDIDSTQIQAQLNDIARSDYIAGARLITAAGIEFSAGAAPPARDAGNRAAGDREVLDVMRLVNTGGVDSAAAPLGKLFVGFNHALLKRTILQEVGKIIAFIVVFTAVLCAMLLRVLRHKVTAPLTKLSEHVSSLTPETLGQPMPALRPAGKWRDEMDRVADGFQTLHDGIERYVGERNQAHEQLREERDHLDATVRDRTALLSTLNQFLATISSVSLRFINKERAEYPAALQQAMLELAALTGAKSVCLAERIGSADDTHWFWHRFNAHEILKFGDGFKLPSGGRELEVRRIDSATVEADWACVLATHRAAAAVVCRQDGEAHGYLLALLDQQGQALADREVTLLAEMLFSTLSRWRSLQEVESARAELTLLSNTDALTGVANRRFFVSRRVEIAQQALTRGQGIAVIMVDIDQFKRFNDTYGHDAGDGCLIAVAHAAAAAAAAAAALPASILFARLGGEEFAAILACEAEQEAVGVAEAIRKAVQALGIDHVRGVEGRVSVSLGVSFTRHVESEPAPLQAAIELLMR